MASKACLVLNRKTVNRPVVEEAVKHVRSGGIELRVRIPWDKEDASRVIEEALAGGAERIIAGGGDGTVNTVANVLVGDGKDRPRAVMGVLPLGTANDFAHGCGLPCDDLKQCLQIACVSPPHEIDVACVNGRYFINVASGGFGAEITATAPAPLKKALGGGAYTIMGLIKALSLKPYEGRLLVPGQEPAEGNMVFMAVGNNRLAGGGFEVAPKARLDDGMLDLAVVSDGPAADIARLAAEVKMPENPDNRFLHYRQLSEFTIESTRDLHLNLDGEPMLERKLEFSVLPKHLGVVF